MSTRDNIIIAAKKQIRKSGYYGTGINDLLRDTELPKGSLYHHFPGGKDEIIETALEEAAMEMALVFKNAMKGKRTAAQGLSAIVDLYLKDYKNDMLKYGCPLASVSHDVTAGNEALRATCSRLFDFWKEAITSYLIYKGVVIEAVDKSEKFLIMLEGAIMLSRVQKSDRPLRLVKKEIESLIR